MNSVVLCVATLRWVGWLDSIKSWYRTASPAPMSLHAVCGKEILPAYQECYESTREPFLGCLHDDVLIHEPDWDLRVRKEFLDPAVGVVGFGGALGHGTPNLYTVPYHLPNLARQTFLSNMRNAEEHGGRFTGERDVAILDGFALFVRRAILDESGAGAHHSVNRLKFAGHNCQLTDLCEPCECCGWHCRVCGQRFRDFELRTRCEGWKGCHVKGSEGWPIYKPYGYFMYSEWLCCEARRQGYRIRLVGVDCEHLGGKSSIAGLKDSYEEAHKYFYDNNRDVMPYRVAE